MEAEKPIGQVGTLVAASPITKTVVVDIPLENGILRLGADVTQQTTLTDGGKRIGLEELQPGDQVRVQFRRAADRDTATVLERLASTGR